MGYCHLNIKDFVLNMDAYSMLGVKKKRSLIDRSINKSINQSLFPVSIYFVDPTCGLVEDVIRISIKSSV